MDQLKQTIENKGQVLSDQILKVDSFLNHQIDTELMVEMGKAFASHFENSGITKVITIESGGIVPAFCAAQALHVPLLFAKKAEPSTMRHPLYTSVHSFTKNRDYKLCIEGEMLDQNDVVLFIDDFLANGEAFKGMLRLMDQVGCRMGGVGICIEKAWQHGRQVVLDQGIDYLALASIASMSPDTGLVWMDEEE